MAAIFAHLFNNVNLATAWYYNIPSHIEVALAPYSPESICIFPVGFGVGELVTHSQRDLQERPLSTRGWERGVGRGPDNIL